MTCGLTDSIVLCRAKLLILFAINSVRSTLFTDPRTFDSRSDDTCFSRKKTAEH